MNTSTKIHLGGRISRPASQVLFLRSDVNYTHIHLKNGEHHIVATTLKELERRLCPFGFWRCNKSNLVNLSAVKILKNDGVVKIRDFEPIRISRRKKTELPRILDTLIASL
jgi:two-component system LytT family response regulator